MMLSYHHFMKLYTIAFHPLQQDAFIRRIAVTDQRDVLPDKFMNYIRQVNRDLETLEWVNNIKQRQYKVNIETSRKLDKFAKSLMIPQLMIKIPNSIEDWIAVVCPDGKRCCVMAQNDNTQAFFLESGTSISFQSLLPYGHAVENDHVRPRYICTVLDCVFVSKLDMFYIIDIIEWADFPCKKMDTELRFDFLEHKFNQIEGIAEISTKNYYSFELTQRMNIECVVRGLKNDIDFFRDDVNLDSVLFFHPDDHQYCEKSRLFWLKPFMIPEVLGYPVGNTYMSKPIDYINIEQYNKNLNKKNEDIMNENPNQEYMAIEVFGSKDDHVHLYLDHIRNHEEEVSEDEDSDDSAIKLNDSFEHIFLI